VAAPDMNESTIKVESLTEREERTRRILLVGSRKKLAEGRKKKNQSR